MFPMDTIYIKMVSRNIYASLLEFNPKEGALEGPIGKWGLEFQSNMLE